MGTQNFKKASTFLDEIMSNSLRHRGFIYHSLFNKWNEIIGEDISEVTSPIKLKFSQNKSTDAVLTIRVNAALAPQIQLLTENILQRINQFYGLIAVRKIKFNVSHEFDLLGKFEQKNKDKNQDSNKKSSNSQFEQQEIFPIKTLDPEFRALLETLQKNWFNSKQKCNKGK